MSQRTRFMSLLALVIFSVTSIQAATKKKKSPVKIAPVSADEKAKLLAAETEEQKAMRVALKAAVGKIAFCSNLDGAMRIYTMRPDGSGVTCLTPAPGPGGGYPHISPDGKKILFSAGASKKLIATMPKDPKLKRKITSSCVYVMDIEGGERTAVAAGGGAHWSWDGKKIAYAFDTMGRKGYGSTAIVDLEAKTETVITAANQRRPIHMPCFSPDGKFAMVSNGAGLLIKLNEKGTASATPAKRSKVVGGHPCNLEISPDGKWWSWVIDTHGDTGGWLSYAAAKYDGRKVRGKNFKLGWESGSVNYYPDWSPDTKYLIYVHAAKQPGIKSYHLKSKQEIYITTFPDCKTTVRVTWNGAGNQHPHWR